jgi:hypothetical protein
VECVCACIPQMKVKEFPCVEDVDSCGPLEAPGSQGKCLSVLLGLGVQKARKQALVLML